MLPAAFSPSVGRTSSLRTRPRLHSACALQLIAGQATGWATDPTAEQRFWLKLTNRFPSAADLVAQTFTLDAPVENDGAPVTFYDKVYSSFMVVPEPGSLLLCLVAALPAQAFRSRLQST